jgi:hypothetical protein
MGRFLDFFTDRKESQRDPVQPQTRDYWPLDLPLIRFSEQRADTWTLADACQGVLIMGENGSGKTSGSGQILARKYLQSGFGGLVLCYKTDEADLWRKSLTETGRSDEALFFGAAGDLRFNFLDYEAKRLASILLRTSFLFWSTSPPSKNAHKRVRTNRNSGSHKKKNCCVIQSVFFCSPKSPFECGICTR